MKEIKLTSGEIAIIDDEDFERVQRYSWYFHQSDRCPVSRIRIAKWNYRLIKMHRFILGTETKGIIDHVNGNRMDNRRSNLRVVDASQSAWNKRVNKTNRSGYKGVTYRPEIGNGKWTAGICKDRKRRYLGLFQSAEDAARAYDEAARQLFGEFARLNFPENTSRAKPSPDTTELAQAA